jgi:hypothetical protein
MAKGAVVTVPEGKYEQMKKQAKAHREAVGHAERSAMTHARHGQVKHALMGLGGAYAPVFEAVVTGAGLFWLVNSDTVTKIELFAKHFWLRGLLVIIGGFLLWRRGYTNVGIAVISTGAATLFADWKDSRKKKETAGPDEAGWYGREWEFEPRDWREQERSELPEGVRRIGDRVFRRTYERAA